MQWTAEKKKQDFHLPGKYLLIFKWTHLHLAMDQNTSKCLVTFAYNIQKRLNVSHSKCETQVFLQEFGALLMRFLVSVEICWQFLLFHMLREDKNSTCIEIGHWPYLFWTLPLLTFYILQSTCLCMLYNTSIKDGFGVSVIKKKCWTYKIIHKNKYL